ncbi:MAG: MFS transporter [Cellulomonadaceae bacterium]|jgi:MFS family permease|nr:MFS transporter [Cellulomonadaceae bacterium]
MPSLHISSLTSAATRLFTSLGPAFTRLWTASALSNLADGVLKIAIPLVAVQFTTSPMLLGWLVTCLSLPWLLFSLPIGAITDRVDRKQAMLIANTARGVVAALVAVVLATGNGSIGMLMVAAFFLGIAEVLYDTTAQSIVPQVVGRDHLERANARIQGVEIVANQFVGPPLGGLVVGVAVAFAAGIPAALWAVAVATLATMPGRYKARRASISDDDGVAEAARGDAGVSLANRNESLDSPADQPRQRPGIWADVVEGLKYLFTHKVLRALALMTGLSNLAAVAAGAVFVLFAVGPDSAMHLTGEQFGLLNTTTALGAVTGALVAGRLTTFMGRARSLAVSMFTFACFVGIPALTTNPFIIGAVWAVSGIGLMQWNIIAVSLRQTVTPPHMLGRVNSTYRLLAWGTMPIGAALGGALGQAWGLRAVFIAGAVVTAISAAGLLSVTDASIAEAEAAVEMPEPQASELSDDQPSENHP